MWSGPRRLPVPGLALAEQPGSHGPAGPLGRRADPAREVAMITHTTVEALGQARLADLHDQARRDALARAARRARRAQRQHSTHRATGLLAALTRWARQSRGERPLPAPREG